FHPEPGTVVSIGLRVGQDFVGDAVRRSANSIERFFVRQNGHDQDVHGIDGADPAGFVKTDGPATALVVYCSRGAYIEMPADKFEDYLRLEGLERIVTARKSRGTSSKPCHEHYTRHAKSILT